MMSGYEILNVEELKQRSHFKNTACVRGFLLSTLFVDLIGTVKMVCKLKRSKGKSCNDVCRTLNVDKVPN